LVITGSGVVVERNGSWKGGRVRRKGGRVGRKGVLLYAFNFGCGLLGLFGGVFWNVDRRRRFTAECKKNRCEALEKLLVTLST
jgi:hypothetical protein